MSDLLVSVEDGVAVLTLNRPERRNAFSAEMGRLLSAAYRNCDEDDAVRAVVVTGTPPAFCAGADMTAGGATFDRVDSPGFTASPVSPAAWEVRKPVIAAINGHAVGIGLTLALQSDIRIVAADAKYGVVQVRRGVIPDAMSHWSLPRLAGLATAADVLLTGRLFDGHEAVAMGLAGRCLPNDEVLPAALELARDVVANVAPLSAAISKRLLWESVAAGRTPAEVEQLETALHHHVMGRADAKEGVSAFLEQRPAAWTSSVSADFPAPWPQPRADDPLLALSRRYAAAADRRDADAFLAVFTPDARLTVCDGDGRETRGTIAGHDELRAIPDRLGRWERTFHLLGQSAYEHHGDHATGEVHCVAHHLRDGTDMVMFIRYADRYVTVGGTWQIAERRVQVDWTETRTVEVAT